MISLHDIKAVVEENGRFRKARRHAAAIEEHQIERDPTTSDSRSQTVACLTGEAGLDSDEAFVRRQQDIGVAARHMATVGQWYILFFRSHNLGEATVSHAIT